MPPLTFAEQLQLIRTEKQALRYDQPLSPDTRPTALAGPDAALSETGQGVCLVFAQYNNKLYRDQIIAELAIRYPEQAVIAVTKATDLCLEAQQSAHYTRLIHVLETDAWFDDGEGLAILQRLNQGLGQISCALVIWLCEDDLEDFIDTAPDLWEGGDAEVDFCNFAQDGPTHPIYAQFIDEHDESHADRPQRLIAINQYLASKSTYSLADSFLWLEQARILANAGGFEAALAAAKHCLDVRQHSHDQQATLLAFVELADILHKKGDWDEALRIRSQEILPLYETLGDQRGAAVTQGKIAEVLQAQGKRDEALQLTKTQVLPMFEALGDKRGLLVAQTKLALLLEDIGPKCHIQEIRTLLTQALHSAEQLNMSEQAIIRMFLNEFTDNKP